MPRAQVPPPTTTEEDDKIRAQFEKGVLKNGKVVWLQKKGFAESATLAERTAAYERKSLEARTAGYKHYVAPGMKKNKHVSKATPATPFITGTATGQFGFPLAKFPEQKFIHSKLIRLSPNRVDYSVDEIDIEWLKRTNKHRRESKKEMLPVALFEFWLDRLEKNCQFKPREIQKMLDENGKELDDVCNVCLDGDTSNCNQIVYCEMCTLTVHQDCYGIPYLPEGPLVCRRCGLSPGKLVRCELCPSQAGAFKQLPNGKWVHVLCVIWVDETHFGNTIFMEYVQNVEKAIHDRRALSCQLCKNKVDAKMGACIQCSETKCTASFHVTCARNAGLVMRVSETDDGHVNRWVWCMKHTPEETEEDIEQKERMIRNARRESERNLPCISMPTVSLKVIATISSETPTLSPEDYREFVLYWYLKRRHRLGAPLLKKFSQPNDIQPRSRLLKCSSHIYDPKIVEMDKNIKLFKADLHAISTMADLVLRREEKKRQFLVSSLRMFERGFKPSEQLVAEVIEAMIKRDEKNIFTQPVDLEGYLDEIARPMCFQTMTKKSNAGKYRSIADLKVDVDLMFRNCAKFNVGNDWFLLYGKNFRRVCEKFLKIAAAEEADRNALKNDSNFLTQLLNGVMGEYTGWTNKVQPKEQAKQTPKVQNEVEIVEVSAKSSESSSQPPPKRRRRQPSPPPKLEEMKVEDVDMDDQQPPPSTSFATPKRPRSRRRGGQDRKPDEDESQKPSTSFHGSRSDHSAAGPSTSAASLKNDRSPSQGPKWSGTNTAQTLRRQVETFGGDVTPKSSKKGPSTSSTPSSSLRQTTLTNFFCAVPKAQEMTFSDVAAAKPNSNRSLFDISSPAGKNTRSAMRSSAAASSVPSTSAGPKSSFRMSSSALKSPLPEPRKIGVRAMFEDDDDEDEIIISTTQQRPVLTEEEIEAEKIRVAENEAVSKYAHNQLVIVDGRAAKVIQQQLAHLSDIHREQRQSMMKKRREVLGEIVELPSIYVEFFQKSANLENFKWVAPEAVELLDINRSPKVVGLRAAKEWYTRVMNGEDV